MLSPSFYDNCDAIRKNHCYDFHDLNLSCRYADYLVAVQQGKVYATGTQEQVMTELMVRDVFNLECRIVPDLLSDTPMCIPMGRRLKVIEPELNQQRKLN